MTHDTLTDLHYMRRALVLARKGVGQASPNPTVGCVLVRGQKIIAQGWHQYARVDHADTCAIREARGQARGATLYATLEPCSHQGRTPSCAKALIQAGIRRVVVAMIDPNPLVSGKGIALLRDAGIRVDIGLCQEEAQKLNEAFACLITTGRPLIVSKVGMSLDGRIAPAAGKSAWITSPRARDFTQTLRLQSDAVLVGSRTILTDDPMLTYRGKLAKARPLTRVVLDSRLVISPNARLFRHLSASPVLIFCGPTAVPARRRRLEQLGAEVIVARRRPDGLDLGQVVDELGQRRMLSVLVEGGSEVHWSFLAHKLVDKFYFIVGALVLGGKRAVPAVGGQGFPSVEAAPPLIISEHFRVGPDLVLETYPRYSRSIASPWRSSETPPSGARGSSRPSRRK